MNTIARFVLDDKRNIIDVLNPTRRKGYCDEEISETQINLRERILRVRLRELADNLFELQPETVDRFGTKHRASRPERHSIWFALCSLIRATHLHVLDPEVALQKRFSGQLRRKKVGLQSFTSLALFMDDVEKLLRDLYGDLEGLEPVVQASSVIVQVLIEHTHQDLWQEFQDAGASDYASGVGVPEGYCVSNSEFSRGW